MNPHDGQFSAAIARENEQGYLAVIPDIKCISPKEGDLLKGRNPVAVAKRLVEYGAPALSVVTERERFGGSPKLLREIVTHTGVPVLRKDFVRDENMLVETVKLGAAAVLLICAITDEENLYALYKKAIELGLEPLVEVHTVEEMEFAKKIGAKLIGINNRDIVTLEMDSGDVSRTSALAANAPTDALLISESGILSRSDAKLAASVGANAVLVGTALWQARDMGAMVRSLRVSMT